LLIAGAETTVLTFKQVRACLPVETTHTVLRLMPLRAGAPPDYLMLQEHVCAVLAPGLTATERAVALVSFSLQFDRYLVGVPDPHALLVEVANLVCATAYSFQAAEVLTMAELNRRDIYVEEHAEVHTAMGLPLLRSGRRGHLVADHGEIAGLQPLGDAMARLSGLSRRELGAMPHAERRAAIRLLRLYAIYGGGSKEVAGPELREHSFKHAGLAIWRSLVKGLAPTDDPDIYGLPAIQRIQRAVGASASAKRLARASFQKAPDEESATDDAREVAVVAGPVHLVVKDPFPPPRESEDRAVLSAHSRLQKPMPLALLPTVEELEVQRTQLLNEFAWADNAIDAIFHELCARKRMGGLVLGFKPVMLKGPTGSGKTRLARRLGEVLNIRTHTLNAGGLTDSMSIVGTSRGWSTGQPSPLLWPLLHGNATALVVLDDVDKAADLTRNSPPLQNALLSLFDQEEARRWRDSFLQVECDLSPLLWVLTCNDITWLSAALRSRLNIHEIRRPTRSELYGVVDLAVRDLESEWRLPSGVLKGAAIAELLPARMSSLRDLKKGIASAVSMWIEATGRCRH